MSVDGVDQPQYRNAFSPWKELNKLSKMSKVVHLGAEGLSWTGLARIFLLALRRIGHPCAVVERHSLPVVRTRSPNCSSHRKWLLTGALRPFSIFSFVPFQLTPASRPGTTEELLAVVWAPDASSRMCVLNETSRLWRPRNTVAPVGARALDWRSYSEIFVAKSTRPFTNLPLAQNMFLALWL